MLPGASTVLAVTSSLANLYGVWRIRRLLSRSSSQEPAGCSTRTDSLRVDSSRPCNAGPPARCYRFRYASNRASRSIGRPPFVHDFPRQDESTSGAELDVEHLFNHYRVTPSLCDALHLLIETCMKSLTETQWQLEDSFVSCQDQNISSGIQNCRANLAMLQMFLDFVQFRSFQATVEVARDVLPDVFAIYNQGNHLRLGLTCFSCGASVFCNIIRARCSLTFTDATEMPRASADSFTLNSSTSRNKKISR